MKLEVLSDEQQGSPPQEIQALRKLFKSLDKKRKKEAAMPELENDRVSGRGQDSENITPHRNFKPNSLKNLDQKTLMPKRGFDKGGSRCCRAKTSSRLAVVSQSGHPTWQWLVHNAYAIGYVVLCKMTLPHH
eukprot:1278118-Amphidinium_carterae.1